MFRSTRRFALVLLLAGCAGSTQLPDPGFNPAEISTTTRPQDDFWEFVNGNWLATTDIPADKSSYGTFHILNDKTEEQIRSIVDRVSTAVADGSATADEQTLGAIYGSYLDTDTIETEGLTPLADEFARIEALDSLAALTVLFGEYATLGVTTPVLFYTDNDATDASRLILYLWQGGLGLPNRDYYLSDQEKLVQARTDYEAHIANMFDLAGWDGGEAAARDILALETRIAGHHWTQVQNRDRQTIYSNQYGFSEAGAHVGGFDLNRWFSGFGMPPPDKLVMAQTSYFENLEIILGGTPLSVWKNYLRFHLLRSFASYGPSAIDEENFDFSGRKLRGQETQADRWKRGVRVINRSAGELLGKIYVQEYFPEASKVQISELVENLREAFRMSISELEWMSEATREQALIKLDAFLPKLGYPNEWRDYDALNVAPGANIANSFAVRRFNHAYELEQLSQPVDRNEWTTNPQTVNAFYRPTHNSITFPAGILQPPFFSATQDPAINYGAIGSVIGHEFSHGFDDQGRKFDGEGLLRNWWTDEDAAQYQERSRVIVEQFNAFQPLPDTAINGELTLGENIGDLAGVIMAYRAFELSGHADGPTMNGLTPRQRFFVGYALAFRGMRREQYLRELLLRDPHSPGEYRVKGILPNVPGFYEAFNVQEGDGMWLPPEDRAKIW